MAAEIQSEPDFSLVKLLLDLEERLRRGFREDLRDQETRITRSIDKGWEKHDSVHRREAEECDERMAPLASIGRVGLGLAWFWTNWKQVGLLVGAVVGGLAFARSQGWWL